ncbi:efflux RND transporter periplasmic adaptor subunit [Photobacterium aphoticum]|uniref:Membrane protein n=2 Tax=Photobacterium aphoticum TaxID=754436 RepID=A0A0J1GRA3_9GAMM|nr:efflux RND transporter periplasmic adaptor subunit [Photobacterium aphoticum]KLV02181.1 membrane protein [Photobacterium aphoticum]PSU60297.1 efflux RND transporter periplasmic adaptor subunit [Photobacterium aphoticum]GHA34702.1 MexE family multidrug efflux RND transporter periplasmic adaptor subunit [Photobacterium aphoticum]
MNKKLMLATLISTSLLVGCGEKATGQPGAMMPLVAAQPVTVIDYQQGKQFVGRTEAMEDVAITAQVSGYLKSRSFQEGEQVEKGQLLFEIEPAAYEARLASAQASVSQAEATLKRANLDWQRGENLLPKGSISQSEYDRLTAEKLNAEAQLKAAKAQVKAAEVDLSYTRIVAPFSGRISDSKVSIGDLVSPNAGVLTTLVSLDPMQASFNVSERQRLELGIDSLDGAGKGSNDVEVVLTLSNGEQYDQLGTVDYIGNRIDLNTGTIAMRASFNNAEQVLLPGQHVQVFLREKSPVERIVIPRRAVQSDLEGDFVMVLTDGNVAERRNVKLGPQTEQGIIIASGVNTDDTVLTKGLQRVRNGVTVRLENEEAKG